LSCNAIWSIKGHQRVSENSKIEVKLNAHVDKMAKESIMDQPQHIPMVRAIRIYGNEKQLFSVPSVIQHCQEKISQEYWQSKLGEYTYKQIDWEIYKKNCQLHKNSVAVKKMVSGLTPTKQRLRKVTVSTNSECPLCHDLPEDIHHVLHCPNNPERICINQDKILHRVKKYGDIQSEVQTILQSLKSRKSPKDHTDLHSQQSIGWSLFIQGKVSTQITTYITHKMKKPGTEQKCVITICHLVITQWKRAWLY
jgi:zinc-binding in reverse transcriptase